MAAQSKLRLSSIAAVLLGTIAGWLFGLALGGDSANPDSRSPTTQHSRPIGGVGEFLAWRGNLVDYDELDERIRLTPEAELCAQIESFDAGFWTTNPNASMLAQLAWKRLFSGAPLAGLEAAKSLFARLQLSDKLGPLFQSMIEGAFSSTLPTVPVLADELATLSKWQVRLVLKAFLDRSPPASLASTQATLTRLLAKGPWTDAEIDLFSRQQIARHPASMGDLAQLFKGRGDARFNSGGSPGFAEFAALHPSEALRRVTEFAVESPREAGVLASLSRLPFDQVFAIADQFEEKKRQEFYAGLVADFGRNDPSRIARLMMVVPLAKLSGTTASGLLTYGVLYAPKTVQPWLDALEVKERVTVLEAAIRYARSTQSVSQAENYLRLRLPLGDATAESIFPFLETISRTDVRKAGELAVLFPESMRADAEALVRGAEIYSSVMTGMDQFMERLNGTDEKARARAVETLGKVAARPTESGRFSPEKILERLQRPEDKLQFCLGAVSWNIWGLSEQQQTLLGTELLRLAPDSEPAQKGILKLMASLPHGDPVSAAALLNQLPAGKIRDQSVHAFVANWADANPAAASAWTRQMPAGRERDLADSAFVSGAPGELGLALPASQAIEDPALRTAALKSLAQAWSKVDPTAFSRAAAEAGISAAEQAQWRNSAAPVQTR